MAVAYHQLGWKDAALDAARRSYALDPTIPEASYDLALLTLESSLRDDGTPDATKLPSALLESRRLLAETLSRDANFFDAAALAGSTKVLEGQCDEGMREIRDALALHPGKYRFYPVSTGQGDIQAAGLHRRVHITEVPKALRPDAAPSWCATGRS